MKTVPLGNTGIDVSALCLGAMFFGTRTDRLSSFALLDEYTAAGGSFVDTANIYAHWVPGFKGGESEVLLGEWLKARGNRHQVFLASKTGFDYPGVARGLSAQGIIDECDKSLRRLGIDTIDLYYGHVDDYNTPLEESLEAFNRLVTSGKVRFIGASNYLAWRLEQARFLSEANGWAAFCGVQQRFTYLRLKPGGVTDPQVTVNGDLIDYSRRRNFPILAYSVLLAGAYVRSDREIPSGYVGPDTEARLAMLRVIAAETGATANQLVLAWMLHNNYPVIPLIAASTHAQLQENLKALDVSLTPDQMDRLEHAGS